MSNEYEAARAARAWDTIRAYAEAGGNTMEDRPLEFWLEELMTDLWHLCEERSFAFEFHAAIACGQLSTSRGTAAPGLTKQESMEQETHDYSIPEEAIGSVRRLVTYLWDDELRGFSAETDDDEEHRRRHVFRDVYRLAKLALGATVRKSTRYSESDVRYTLVRINGLDVLEENGEVRYTDWDGDDFRDAVGILLGAAAEMVVALECGRAAERGVQPPTPRQCGEHKEAESHPAVESVRDALQRVVAYLWDDELIDFTQALYWHVTSDN